MDLNRATILGRMTRDPEVKTTPSGQSVTTFSLATNKVWTDDAGVKQEKVEFHNCVAWRKLAEIIGQYMTKGRRAYVEGRLQTRDWVGQDGVKKYRTEIVVDNLIMLDGPRGSGQAGNVGGNEVPMPAEPESLEGEEIKVEDIPF